MEAIEVWLLRQFGMEVTTLTREEAARELVQRDVRFVWRPFIADPHLAERGQGPAEPDGALVAGCN